jgi:L-alanine-DL-glutamate epimerase-like enolase superfamily enzyme
LVQIYKLSIANGGGWPLSNMHTFAGLMKPLDCGAARGMVQVGQMLFVKNPEPKNGILTIPDAPGFALTLNRKALPKSEVTQ